MKHQNIIFDQAGSYLCFVYMDLKAIRCCYIYLKKNMVESAFPNKVDLLFILNKLLLHFYFHHFPLLCKLYVYAHIKKEINAKNIIEDIQKVKWLYDLLLIAKADEKKKSERKIIKKKIAANMFLIYNETRCPNNFSFIFLL